MNALNKAQFIEHAKLISPREACGLIVNLSGEEKFYPCRNIAENQTDFVLSPEDYVSAEDAGQVLGVVHSHPNSSPKPSQADLVGCETSGLPWFIYSLQTQTWEELTPKGYRAPLLGRPFAHGLLDCFSLVRDWYKETLKIELPDFDRGVEWWNKGQNLYMENFEKAGFRKADGELQVGDIILMQIRAKAVNHSAIYLGRDVILHHLMNRLSCREVYGGYYKKNTRLIVRHEALL